MRRILIISVLLVFVTACSIKEDRSACPANIHLRLSERSLSIAGGLPVGVRVSDSGGTKEVGLSAAEPDCWIAVEKGGVDLVCLLDNGAGISVPPGRQCDSIWADSSHMLAEYEECEVLLDLHKRFATVFIDFEEGVEPWRYDISVCGNVVGTGLPGLEPVSGEFRFQLDVEDGAASVRVPCQGSDSSLRLLFESRTPAGQSWDWDLAGELARLGYDWSQEDLADIRVHVKLLSAGLGIEIGSWKDGGSI